MEENKNKTFEQSTENNPQEVMTADTSTRNYLSLFDFLGKAAGEKLGLEVWEAALRGNIPTSSRHVSNSKYTGNIVLYPLDFLEDYFKVNPTH